MKKILFVDTFCGYGHNNINKIYIKSFISQGFSVHVAMRKSYFITLDLNPELLILDFPDKYFSDNCSKLVSKINQFRLITFINFNTSQDQYDFYFFSYFDEIPFYFSGFRRNVILMVHGNTENLNSLVKRFFIKKISNIKNLRFIVFSEYFKIKFLEKNIYNVIVSPHGCPEPIIIEDKIKDSDLKELLTDLKCPHLSSKIIFVPNGKKFGDDSLDKLLSDNIFMEFITINNLILIVRGSYIHTLSDRVYFLPGYVEKCHYDSLLLNCSMIMLNYPTSFELRVSGIFFECIANNKAMVLSNVYAFNQFKTIFNYNPFYNNLSELIKTIKYLILVDDNFSPYTNLNLLEPKPIDAVL